MDSPEPPAFARFARPHRRMKRTNPRTVKKSSELTQRADACRTRRCAVCADGVCTRWWWMMKQGLQRRFRDRTDFPPPRQNERRRNRPTPASPAPARRSACSSSLKLEPLRATSRTCRRSDSRSRWCRNWLPRPTMPRRSARNTSRSIARPATNTTATDRSRPSVPARRFPPSSDSPACRWRR